MSKIPICTEIWFSDLVNLLMAFQNLILAIFLKYKEELYSLLKRPRKKIGSLGADTCHSLTWLLLF